MAEVVDSIIAELILRDQGYSDGMRKIIDLNKELRASYSGLGTVDAAVEQSATRQVASRRKQTDAEKAAAKETAAAAKQAAKEASDAAKQSAKERADAAKQAAKAEADAAKEAIAAKKAVAEAERQLAVASAASTREQITNLERLKAAEREASNQAKANAFLSGGGQRPKSARASASVFRDNFKEEAANASAPVAPINPPPIIYDRADTANNRRTGTLRPAGDGDLSRGGAPMFIPAATLAGDAEAATAKEVNNYLADRYDLTQKARLAEGELAAELAHELAFMERLDVYRRAGLSEAQAVTRAETEALAIDKLRTEQAEKQAVAQRSGGASNGLRFAEGAGLGRTGGNPGALAGIVTAGIVAGGAEIVKSSIDFGKELQDTSEQLGLTTKQVQVYQRAALDAGVSTEQFKSAFGHLNTQLGQAQLGDKTAATLFKNLGVNVRDFKSAGDALPTVIQQISSIADPAKRAAYETKAFGEEGRRLDSVLGGGNAKINDLAAALERTGAILSDKDIKNLDQTADKLAQIKAQLQVDFAKIVANNQQAILTLAQAFATLAEKAAGAINAIARFKNQNQYVSGDPKDQQQAYSNLIQDPQGRQFLRGQLTDQLHGLKDTPALTVNGKPDENARASLIQQKGTGILSQLRQVLFYKDPQTSDPKAAPLAKVNLDDPFAHQPKDRKGPDLVKQAAEREQRYQDELARSQEEYLAAQNDLVSSSDLRLQFEQASVEVARKKRDDDITSEVAEKKIDAAKADELREANNLAAAAKQAVLARERQNETYADVLAASQREYSLQTDIVRGQEAFAKTASDRLALALKQIDLDQQNDRDQAIHTLFDPNASDRDKTAAGAALSSNQQRFDIQRTTARQQERSPLSAFADALPTTASQIKEQFEQAAVNGVGKVNDALDTSIDKMLRLHGLAGSILEDFIKLGVQMAEGALFKGFGGLGGTAAKGGGIGGLLGGIGKLLGLGGGSAAAGAGSAVDSSIDPALFGLAGGGSFEVGGNGGIDRNVLSINGQPQVRVNQGETVAVIPKNIAANNSRVNAASPSLTVIAPQNFDLSNAVMTPELVASIDARHKAYTDAVGQAVLGHAVSAARQGVPGAVRDYQRRGSL